MIRRSTVTILIALLIPPVFVFSQATDTMHAPSPPAAAPEDSSTVFTRSTLLFLSSYPLRPRMQQPQSIYIEKSTLNLYEFEICKISRFECALQGASAGATLGMAAGAFGMMAGSWDEQEVWYITGAMAAFGAIFGGTVKAEDPAWNLRVRWKPKH